MRVRIGKLYVSISKDTAWCRGWWEGAWVLKMPWCPAWFSERYGYWPHRRFMGFRFGWRE